MVPMAGTGPTVKMASTGMTVQTEPMAQMGETASTEEMALMALMASRDSQDRRGKLLTIVVSLGRGSARKQTVSL